jgi:hypothetical protein
MAVKSTVSWDVIQSSWVEIHQGFGDTLHVSLMLKSKPSKEACHFIAAGYLFDSPFSADDRSIVCLRNVELLLDHMASHPRI